MQACCPSPPAPPKLAVADPAAQSRHCTLASGTASAAQHLIALPLTHSLTPRIIQTMTQTRRLGGSLHGYSFSNIYLCVCVWMSAGVCMGGGHYGQG